MGTFPLCSSRFVTPQNAVTDFQSVCLTVSFLINCLHRLFINELHSSGSAWESYTIFIYSSEAQCLNDLSLCACQMCFLMGFPLFPAPSHGMPFLWYFGASRPDFSRNMKKHWQLWRWRIVKKSFKEVNFGFVLRNRGEEKAQIVSWYK